MFNNLTSGLTGSRFNKSSIFRSLISETVILPPIISEIFGRVLTISLNRFNFSIILFLLILSIVGNARNIKLIFFVLTNFSNLAGE